MSMTKDQAYKLRALLEQAAQSLPDKEASEVPGLFPRLKGEGALIATGDKINWNGRIKRAANALWDTPENNPDNAPDLWENIDYREGYRIIPDTITTGLAFAVDEYGWWGDALYRSKLAANVWTPEEKPDGWEEAEA